MEYGLIGEKLGHSFSPHIHTMLCGYSYMLTPVGRGELNDFMTRRAFRGINVTIPYKQTVMPYCAELDETAREIGSVNTIVNRGGTLSGYNTDYYGFCKLVGRAGIDFDGRHVVILGSGGTSLTARYAAQKLGASRVTIVSRSGAVNYTTPEKFCDGEILVNTTPVGMYPDMNAAAVSLSMFPKCRGVIDVIYNPQRSRLLLEARAAGIPYANGLAMLVYQAKRAAEIFEGRSISDERAEAVIAALRAELCGIVLVGMPSCGKSTIGRRLSRMLGMRLIDTDAFIEKKSGISIPQIFTARGEAYFRQLEHETIAELTSVGGAVIAVGGGAVLDSGNREAMARNSLVCYIKRDIDRLSGRGRPLSANPEAIRGIYAKRAPLYEECADFSVDNSTSVADAAAEIAKKMKDFGAI